MTNGQNAARGKHLDDLATAVKRFTLQEILNVTEAVTAELENISIGGGTSSGGGSSSTEMILPTVPATVDGGYWCEVTDNKPMIYVRQGNYVYGFNYDITKFVGSVDDKLVAYLPFDQSTTLDLCGNEWTAYGTPTIQDGALYLNGSSYLVNSNIADDIGAGKWTIDFWATAASTHFGGIFGTFNSLRSGDTNKWGCVNYNNGNPQLNLCSNDHTISLGLSPNTRHHYALTYDGTDVRLFVDGVLGKTLTLPIQLSGDFVIGARPEKESRFTGTIDHFRVFYGVALWTENFTPPTAADYV